MNTFSYLNQTRRRAAVAPRSNLPKHFALLALVAIALLSSSVFSQENTISIERSTGPGKERPILVSLSGFSGEAAQVLQLDLYVQGFAFTNAEAAQYLISGSNNGNLQGRVTDHINKSVLV